MCRRLVSVSAAALAATLLGAVLTAATITVNGITLTYPDYPLSGPGGGTPLVSCEPWNSPAGSISLTGVPEGATVQVTFAWFDPYGTTLLYQPTVQFNNVTGGSLTVAVPYPQDTSTWPGFNATTNERSIGVLAAVAVTTGSSTPTKINAKWWVKCAPPPPSFGGCTPGFWRNHTDVWSVYSPTDDFELVFGVDASFNPHTLLDAVWLGGGGERALARHAVAALLNSVSPDLTYPLTTLQIIAGVQNAYATGNFNTFMNQLDAANNAGCPY